MTQLAVQLNTIEFPLHEEFDLPGLNKSCPLTRLTEHLIQAIATHPEVASPAVLLPSSAYPDVEFPADGSRVEIDILLCSTVEALAEWACDTSQGVFMTSGSPLEERMYATRFRVGVPCDIDTLRAFVMEERQLEIDPGSDQHDRSYLEAYLCTLTHELAHAIDFIRHAGGLTPDQVDILYDAGEIDFDLTGAVTGLVARQEMNALAEHPEQAEEAMEERVEAVGRQWLHWALQRVDSALIQECLDCIKPTDISMDLDGPSL